MASKYCIRFRYGCQPHLGLVPMLCEQETGEPLPNQSAVSIKSEANDVSRVTVEFVLGDDLPIVID